MFKPLITNFHIASGKLYQERLNMLAGCLWLSVIIVMMSLLSGCGSPTLVATHAIAPNVAAVGANATVQALSVQSTAAQLQVDNLNQQSTATSAAATAVAFAPFATGTQAAVDLQIQRMYSDATSTSAAATQTAYMMQQAYNAQATTTAGVATQVAAVTQQAFTVQVNNDQLALERAQTVNQLKAMSLYAIGIVLLILTVARAYVWIKSAAFIPNPVDERGKPQPMIEVINAVSWDMDRSPNGMIGTTPAFLKSLPQITADRQDQVTERAQMVDMQTRIARIPKKLLESQSLKFLPTAADGEEETADMQDADLLLPAWDVINGWNGQSRPLGLGRNGIITAQAASPHLLTTGGTGSGKTAFMLRTQATISLAKGYQVINIGFSNSGFGVFNGHPNYHAIELNQSSDVIDCLASVYRELKERKQIIGGDSVEWEHWHNNQNPPRPFVDILIDELGNLADDIYTSEEKSKEGAVRTAQLWRWMSMIAKEGRKVGIRFIAALQDPTAKSVNIGFRRNCTLVSFQLGDVSQSRAFIGAGGAELLQVGHFMTRMFGAAEGVVIGGGFSPTDDEIRDYLSRHPVQQTLAPNWIEGVTINQSSFPVREPARELSSPAPTSNRVEFVRGLQGWEAQVLDLYESGLSLAQIVETVFEPGEVIGPAAVADLIQRWNVVKGIDMNVETSKLSSEQVDKKMDEIIELAEKIRAKWTPALNKTQVSELLGKTYEGSSWVKKVNQVIEYLKSTTTVETPKTMPNGGLQPTFQ